MSTEGISLGWNCHSATTGVSMGIRRTKCGGYKTCPFDEMITNYAGIVQCIKDGLDDLYNTDYLELIKIPKESKWLNTNGDGDVMIYHTKYKFIFNHESPGHANLFVIQKWKGGANHYIANNYAEFVNRYKRRVQNMKELLASGKMIRFILTRPNTKLCDIGDLREAIKSAYTSLAFDFVLLDFDKAVFCDHLRLMKLDNDDDEFSRCLRSR